jgi:hypothetical protein
MSMRTYEIDVNYVDAGSGKGKALEANPKQAEIELPSVKGKVEHALVTWKFKDLPAGLTPVIAFDSQEVIASGPTTTPGAVPQITFEIKLPSTAKAGETVYASYTISASSGSAKASETLPPDDGPSLVVIRSPDPVPPPSSGTTSSHANV